jgi:catechol 2,3-dioxygenase-like lactoylglutathione lyase family enzyme
MSHPLSRRLFLALATGSTVSRSRSWAAKEVPTLLDHIILGCNDLDRGIAFVEESTGVRAAFGGVHPGRGTRNALLSLGERRYLEIIAPDPNQPEVKQYSGIREMTAPRLVGWAAHPGDIGAFAKKLRAAGISVVGPYPGSRARPDGRILNWQSLSLADDRHGLLPFFIEWSADSIHPSTDAPAGCQLQRFRIAGPDPDELNRSLSRIGIDAAVESGEKAELRARISGPKGNLEVRS